MGGPLQFDYYYGLESEQFRFFRIPKVLFEKDCFRGISCEGKLLYGLMLDQMSLSQRNGWVDEQNRTYILLKAESISESIGCCTDKARKLIKELEGIGLIEQKRRGQGKSNVIYVKNFVRLITEKTDSEKEPYLDKDGACEAEAPYDRALNAEIQGTEINGDPTDEFSEPENSAFKNPKITESRTRKNRILEPEKIGTNDTYNNNTYLNDINNPIPITSYHGEQGDGTEGYDVGNVENRLCMQGNTRGQALSQSRQIRIAFYGQTLDGNSRKDGIDRMDTVDVAENPQAQRNCHNEEIVEQIADNVDYDAHMEYDDLGIKEIYDGLFRTICDVVLGRADSLKIGGIEYDTEVVKERFLSLRGRHLEYVAMGIASNPGEVRNMRKYMIAALFNAPATIDAYYTQRVLHDMYGT